MAVEMIDLFELVHSEGGSDIHLEVGVPPVLRINGNLVPIHAPVLKPEDTERMINSITSDYHQRQIREKGTVDFGFDFKGKCRFRVSAFKQKGYFAAVLRLIPNKLMTLEDIGLSPAIIKDLLYRKRGLILITGPTGSGKSTTLATMVDIINTERNVHIVTIEDPIEFYHQHKQSIVVQREIGTDVPSFDEALRRVLRQDPDVILVGEMRDIETIRAAITAAETGHLVLATLHTMGAAKTIDRIIDAFPENEQEEIRVLLSTSITAIISQLLIEKKDKKGRVAAFEILISTPAIQSLIRQNKTFMLNSEIQTGFKWGMNLLDDSLLDLYQKNIISYTDVLTKAQYPDVVSEKVKAEKR